MDDAQFLIQVKNGVDELFEDDGSLIFLKKAVLFCVLEEISFHHDFCDDVDMGFCFELA